MKILSCLSVWETSSSTQPKPSTKNAFIIFGLLVALCARHNVSAFSTAPHTFSASQNQQISQYKGPLRIERFHSQYVGALRQRSVGFKSKLFQEKDENTSPNSNDNSREIATTYKKSKRPQASKRKMLTFAVPALGISLSSPLLSNIDNAFVGRLAGTAGLAALSPATLCIDQILYLFSFLSRATTGLVARAYASPIKPNGDPTVEGETTIDSKNTEAAREAASAPLSVALFSGFMLSMMYSFFAPNLLGKLNVQPALRPAAASYIYWRGSIAWAALAQSVLLSTILATKDAVTPLKIIGMAALANIAGDALFCVWPFRWGCAGAAAATAIATLISSGFMIRALHLKKLLPHLKVPTKKELFGLMEFTGPLLAITLTRLIGFVSMQRRAMSLGVEKLAGYQLCVNVMILFLLFGEPLSQLSQINLPTLVDKKDGDNILATIKSISIISFLTAIGVGGLSFLLLAFGSSLFTNDLGVQLLARATAPAVFLSVAQAIITTAADGAMLASRDFGFMFLVGVSTCITQLILLKQCTSINAILGTFTLRLGIYAVAVGTRAALGYGALGRAIKNRSSRRKVDSTQSVFPTP